MTILLTTLSIFCFACGDNEIQGSGYIAITYNYDGTINQSKLNVEEIHTQKTLQFDSTVNDGVVLIPDEAHESVKQEKNKWP